MKVYFKNVPYNQPEIIIVGEPGKHANPCT